MTGPTFDHGIASFDPTDTSILLWTRTSSPGEVSWRICADADRTEVVAEGTVEATADSDRTVVVEADGLEPATTYFYDFEQDGVRSPMGRTRTLPGLGAERFRIGVTCCADFSAAPLGVYRALAEREVDIVLHLGDYIYEAQTSRSGRRASFGETCVTLDEYRDRYAQLRADPDVQYLHARHPMVAIWDDHDLADNAWRTGAKAHDPDAHGDWDERVGAASRARAEWVPIRYREPDDLRRTWRSMVVGDLAEILLLDTRYEGRDRQPGDEGTLDRHDPERSLLGVDQRAFVDERLADTSRPWSVVASGVVVNEISLPLPGDGLLPNRYIPNGYAIFDGKVVHDDQWDGYTAEREHLAQGIESRAAHGASTVILSGDVHSCWAFEGPPGTDGDPVAVEAVCPAASSAAMGRANVAGVNRLLDHAVRRMPQVQWANVTERGYAICDLDRERAQFEWWIVDPYSLDPGAEAKCAAVRSLPVGRRPARFEVLEECSEDPVRPAEPEPLPRPDDLGALRAKRFARLATKSAAGAVAVGAAAAAVSRPWWRGRLPVGR